MNFRYCRVLVSFLLLLSVVRSPAVADDALRRKLGQMIIVGFIGSSITDTLLADLSTRNLGGVIVSYANGNLISPLQIQQFMMQIKNAAETPPFIATDEEGGEVARLNASDGFASTYTAYTLGTTFNSIDSTRKEAALMASWMQYCAMNVNFAPVVDVNVNPSSPAIGYYGRSFSADPMTVAAHAQAFIDQFHAAGLITTLKHFPGHGSATEDSHYNLPDITDTWSSNELIPYRQLLGTNSVDIVMVGHLFNAHIDSVYPASLSYATVQGLLRDSLGFGGVAVTDDLYNMGAITDHYSDWDAAEHAINAGVDILLYVNNTLNNQSLVRQMIDTLESKVEQGRISMARIDEAYNRISNLKNRYSVTKVSEPFAQGRVVPTDLRVANYPNPFNPVTTIEYQIPSSGPVEVALYTALGQRIRTLFNGDQAAGVYRLTLDGSGLSSGVYYVRLRSQGRASTRPVVLLK
ncbi:MAG TPA: glycoside hydrolase family 3 N-terminal domain-containing protein [Bacteroidota bacterium]|nr:glycoside hydrolase family 3 N-terminal domain-containing protein [Bacteroidota bacterium]